MNSKFFIVTFLLIIVNCIDVYSDSLYVEVVNDTVFVKNTGVWENCLFRPRSMVIVEGYNITLTQQDTSNNFAFCNCTFDLTTQIIGLNKGNYRIYVYRKYSLPKDTSTAKYLGAIIFSFNPLGSSTFSVKQKQSSCYQISDIEYDIASEELQSLLIKSYPNPFNPSTTLYFEIPGKSMVTLKVYDVLGNEVADLLHEEKSFGKYELVFNPSNHALSSGVYYCRLQAGDLSSIKKLIYVK